MAGKLIVAVPLIGVMILGGRTAHAQESSAAGFAHQNPPSANTGAGGPPNHNIQIVDISRFMQNHPYLSIMWSPTFGSQNGAPPSVSSRGQIQYYGGPLQDYLNTEGGNPLHDIIPSFGASGIIAIGPRVQLLGSAGGILVPFRTSYTMPNAWLTQASLGVRLSLDQGHHFSVGGTARYITDFADKTRQWGLWSADFTFHSGRQ
jgi:hypothetical protein